MPPTPKVTSGASTITCYTIEVVLRLPNGVTGVYSESKLWLWGWSKSKGEGGQDHLVIWEQMFVLCKIIVCLNKDAVTMPMAV